MLSSHTFRPGLVSTPAVYGSSRLNSYGLPSARTVDSYVYGHGQPVDSKRHVSFDFPVSGCASNSTSFNNASSNAGKFDVTQLSRDQIEQCVNRALELGMTPSSKCISETAHTPRYGLHIDNKIEVPTFDGIGNWDQFISRFERIANLACWGELKKTHRLLLPLVGQASLFADRLHPMQTRSYYDLRRALEERYKVKVNHSVLMWQFNTRCRQRGETIRQFAIALQSMVEEMFPYDQSPVKMMMLINQFLVGLSNRECSDYIRLSVPLDRHDSWNQVISRAELYEHIRGPQFQIQQPRFSQVVSDKHVAEVTCYNCRSTGHISHDCPQTRQRSGN